jgi:LuxR family maltose regulon positive regulatory protein
MPRPKLSHSTLTWSQLHQRYELHRRGTYERCFSPDDELAFGAWVEGQTSFAFVGQAGRLSLLKEARSRGSGYWYAYRKRGQHTRKGYLGPSSQVTFARLEELSSFLAYAPPPLARAPAQPMSGRTPTLLSTKLVPPRVPNFLVERPRLLQDLDMAWTHPLTLVSSSAGSGKTTLLSAWASRQKHLVAWLSLDALDTDPTRFWTACLAALRRCQPRLGEEADRLLHTPQAPPLSTILVALLNDIVLLDQEVILIMDDYHVIADQTIHDSLFFVLDHMPSNLHLVLATRTDPAFPLTTLRVRGQLLEIRASELRFTEAEAASFLLHHMNLPLSEEEVAMLTSRTEGWIAGLHLVALSLSKEQNLANAIADFGGSHRYLLDYVHQDILARLTGPLQEFLLQTSVVTRMNADLCQAVTAGPTREASQQMLEDVERANLFVLPLDAQRQWYRYHDLFREALQARLQASRPELVPLLHVRAARWYETQGELWEAITHALDAADYAYAADLMEQAAPAFWLHGEARTVLNWILSLPDAVLRAHLRLALNAVLRFAQYATITLPNQIEALLLRLEGLLHVRTQPNLALSEIEAALIERRLRLLRGWIELRVLLQRGDTKRLRQLSQELEALPADEETSWNFISLSPSFWLAATHVGDGAALITRLHEAIKQMRKAGDVLLTIHVTAMLAVVSTPAAQLQQAQRVCHEALALIAQVGVQTPSEGQLYLCLFNVAYAKNRLDEAANWLQVMQRRAQRWQPLQLRQVLIIGEVSAARLALAQRDFFAAEEAKLRLETLVEQGASAHHLPWVSVVQVQLWLAEGDLEAASTWAAQTTFSEETWNPLCRWEVLMLGRVYLAQQQYHQAVEMLSRFRGYFDQSGVLDTTIEWMALSVVALYRSGERKQALQIAARLLAITEPEGYVRLDLDTGAPLMKEVLEIWLEAHPEEISQADTAAFSQSAVLRMLSALDEMAPRSIRASRGSSAPPYSITQQGRIESLSRREQQVLQLLVAGQTYAEMAQALIVSPNTIKTQVSSIYRKLGVSRRAEAIAAAGRLHLL